MQDNAGQNTPHAHYAYTNVNTHNTHLQALLAHTHVGGSSLVSLTSYRFKPKPSPVKAMQSLKVSSIVSTFCTSHFERSAFIDCAP